MTPTDLLDPVCEVLREATHGKSGVPWMVSSYQVLDRLPAEVRDQLVGDQGGVGSGIGGHRGAAHVVAKALDMLEHRGEATTTYLDTRGVRFVVAGEVLEGGYGPICKLYRHAAPKRG